MDHKELVMQTIRNIQGTKSAEYEWYQLLGRIFKILGMKPNSTCNRIWILGFEGEHNYLVLATYDILIVSNSSKPLQELKS